MPTLRETQQAFAAALLGREPHPFHERLRVYRNNFILSLAQALADVFPVLERLVGPEYFGQLARRYVREHPSRSGNLHDFGREMAAFLTRLPEAEALPYLADVAALEWAWHECFHAAEAPALDVTRLAALSPAALESVRLRLHPAVRLVASRYPILAIWEANQDGAPPERSIALDAGADWLLVARRGLARTLERLEPGEYALLAALGAGATLAEACGAAAAAAPQPDVGGALSRFVAARVITDFH